MNAILVNRLVGTIALVGLIVLVLPSILDGEKQTHERRFIDIPQPPPFGDVQTVTKIDEAALRNRIDPPAEPLSGEIAVDAVQTNTSAENITSTEKETTESSSDVVPSAESAAQQTVSSTPPEEAQEPISQLSLENQTVIARDDATSGVGWVVQMGSFQHQKNVKELMAKLKENGFRTFSREVPTQRGTLTKVFVGPELDREKLEGQLTYLKELTTLSGRISRFEAVPRP